MGMDYMYPAFEVLRNPTRCVNCGICVKECANGVHFYQKDGKQVSQPGFQGKRLRKSMHNQSFPFPIPRQMRGVLFFAKT